MRNFGLFFIVFKSSLSTSTSIWRHNSGFQPSSRKEVSNKNVLLFRTGYRYNTYLNFWDYCYCSSNKTDIVQLFKNIFAFIGLKFQDYSKKFESLLSICKICTFSVIQEYHFNDHFVRFQHWLPLGLQPGLNIIMHQDIPVRKETLHLNANNNIHWQLKTLSWKVMVSRHQSSTVKI